MLCRIILFAPLLVLFLSAEMPGWLHILDLESREAGSRRFFYVAGPGVPLLLPGTAPGHACRINEQCTPLFLDWRGEDCMLRALDSSGPRPAVARCPLASTVPEVQWTVVCGSAPVRIEVQSHGHGHGMNRKHLDLIRIVG